MLIFHWEFTCGPVDDGVPLVVQAVDGGAAAQQQADEGAVAGDGGQVEGRVAVFVSSIQQLRRRSQHLLRAADGSALRAIVERGLLSPVPLPHRTRLLSELNVRNMSLI